MDEESSIHHFLIFFILALLMSHAVNERPCKLWFVSTEKSQVEKELQIANIRLSVLTLWQYVNSKKVVGFSWVINTISD